MGPDRPGRAGGGERAAGGGVPVACPTPRPPPALAQDGAFFDFARNTRAVKSSITHFQASNGRRAGGWMEGEGGNIAASHAVTYPAPVRQCPASSRPPTPPPQLRNLLWATSRHDVYTVQDSKLVHWSAATRERCTARARAAGS